MNSPAEITQLLIVVSYHELISYNSRRKAEKELYEEKYYLLQFWVTKLPKLDENIQTFQERSCKISEA